MDASHDSTPEPGDHALMARAAAGDAAAFAALARRHQDALVNFFRRLGVYNEAEDLTQETLLRVYKYRRKYRPETKFTTFLYVLARNVWRDHGRRLGRRDKLRAGLETEAAVDAAAPPADAPVSLDVEQALAGLSPKLREVVVLNVLRGLRYQEVAEVLSIPVGTVKSRMNLAMHTLRKALNEKREQTR